MRVLHIVDNLAIKSGVSSVVMNIYRNINRNKVQFDFLVMNYCEVSYVDEIRALGGEIYYVKSPLSLRNIFESINETKKFFKNYAMVYDVVHLHSPTTIYFNLRFAKQYGIQNRIVHSHSSIFSNNKIKNLIDIVLCLNLKKYANIYWACSQKAREFLYGKNDVQNHQIEIINNAIDCKRYSFDEDIREKYRLKLGISDKYVIGHVSRFDKIKNHIFLLDVFCDICKHNDDLVLVLVGDGPTYQKCQDYARSKGIGEKVIFLGFRADINNILQSFDTFVLPSLREGLPIVAVEAQASGLPCYLSSSITREVNLGNIKYLDLDINIWSKALQRKVINNNRSAAFDIINSSAFNIKQEAKRVENLYIKMYRKEIEI